MARVKVSEKYQIVIPREVRKASHIRKGQMVSVISIGDVIEIIPDRDIRDMEGMFPGISLEDVREETDRLEEAS
jgi:AbrB family looped-hinge helix DNA binding protein